VYNRVPQMYNPWQRWMARFPQKQRICRADAAALSVRFCESCR